MTSVLSGNADIGFMGSEASIYTYNEGANDYVVNFAQLTQRAGNFLVAREKIDDFSWENLKGKEEVVSKFKNFLNPEQQQKLDSIMNKISEAEIQDKINSKKAKTKKSASHHSSSGKKTVKKVKRVKKG